MGRLNLSYIDAIDPDGADAASPGRDDGRHDGGRRDDGRRNDGRRNDGYRR
jgi:hypothetical protein